jgi:hypothetical protein
MPFDPHERARFLIDESRIAGISAEESLWLRAHIAECAACTRHEETTARILTAMSDLSFGGAGHRVLWPARQPKAAVRRFWPLAAAALILLCAIPLLRPTRDARQDESDALLLERVGDHVSRSVPQALEPLMNPESGVQQ